MSAERMNADRLREIRNTLADSWRITTAEAKVLLAELDAVTAERDAARADTRSTTMPDVDFELLTETSPASAIIAWLNGVADACEGDASSVDAWNLRVCAKRLSSSSGTHVHCPECGSIEHVASACDMEG